MAPPRPHIPLARRRLSHRLLSGLLLLGLAACGGGGGDDGGSAGAGSAAPSGVVGVPSTPTGSSTGSSGSSTGSPLTLDATTSCNLPSFRDSLLQQINAARAAARSCGGTAMPAVGALSWNDRLFSAAARHSTDMAVNNYFSHKGLDGRSASQRVTDEGYSWSRTGENIAAGQSSVTTVMNGWLASEGHCANIMGAGYVDVAVSCVQHSGSEYGRYWTMVLARPN